MSMSSACFDARDAEILRDRITARETIKGPRIGDFVYVDGILKRFTYDHGDTIQTTGLYLDASFHLNASGYADYSGGLAAPIPKDRIKDTGNRMNGHFWFFHHDNRMAHNGVECHIVCRVYEVQS